MRRPILFARVLAMTCHTSRRNVHSVDSECPSTENFCFVLLVYVLVGAMAMIHLRFPRCTLLNVADGRTSACAFLIPIQKHVAM